MTENRPLLTKYSWNDFQILTFLRYYSLRKHTSVVNLSQDLETGDAHFILIKQLLFNINASQRADGAQSSCRFKRKNSRALSRELVYDIFYIYIGP